MTKPLAIDLFCGLGGWAEGLLAEGWDVIGFDIEQHEYAAPEIASNFNGHKGTKPVAKRGWTQGCAVSLGMEGDNNQPRTRLLKYPGLLAIQDVLTLGGSQFKGASLIVASPPCQEYSYMAMPWSRAKAIAAEYRSGKRDVKQLTALFDACFRIQREACEAAGRHIPLIVENVRGAEVWVGEARAKYGSFYLWGDVPVPQPGLFGNERRQSIAAKGHKLPGFRFDGSGRSFQTASVNEHVKLGGSWFHGQGPWNHGSNSKARKAASAMIAKIPLPLARHIARAYLPTLPLDGNARSC